MKTDFNLEPGTDWQVQEADYRFFGPPDNCRGELVLCNHAAQKLKVRRLPLQPADGRRKGLTGALELSASVREPGNHRVPARLRLPPETPPGTYQQVVVCGNQKLSVNVHIAASPRYELQWETPLQKVSAGGQWANRLYVRNRGNTTLTLPKKAMVWFEEQDWVGRILVHSLRETDADAGYEAFLSHLHQRFRSSMQPLAQASFDLEEPDVPPGGSAFCPVTVKLPEKLEKGRVYRGFIKLDGRKLWLELQAGK